MRNIGGPGQLRDAVAFASLDPELFELLKSPAARREIQATLIQTYCPQVADRMWKALEEEVRIESHKQKLLREESTPYTTENEKVRNSAFRRMIREIYDVRCAACGIRFFFLDVDLIDAAHLIPFSDSRDDRPQNGIALCKNHHWLMDQDILVPGPGRGQNYHRPVWHVHKGLDNRFEEHKAVLELHNRSVILPSEARYAPCREALEWLMDLKRKAEAAV